VLHVVYQSLHRAFAGFFILLLAATSAQAQGPGARPTGGPGVGGPPSAGGPPAAAAAAPAPYSAPRAAAGGPHPMGGIALIDLGFILKNHAGFLQRSEEFRQQWEGRETDIKAKQDSARKLAMQLNDFQKGSAKYKELEEEVAKRTAELQLEINLTKKKFQESEAKLFYDAYKQIYNEVRLHCEQNNIMMVIKFNGEPPNPDNPEEIGAEMFNKQTLYYNPGIDITPAILARLKSQLPQAAGGRSVTPPGGGTAMRPGVPTQPQPTRQQ
jgi:Skp family chaperone for outer membrane proteins